MIKNNKFYLKKINTIVFLGYEEIHEKLTKINESLKIKSIIFSSKKKIKSSCEIKYYRQQKLDKKFEKLILDNCIPDSTLFISLSARWLFNKKIINDLFKNNLINFHNARLPIDAGGGGYSWRIMRNDRVCNLLAHVVDENIDTGPIIFEQSSVFPSICKTPQDFENHESLKFLSFYKKIISDLMIGKKFQLLHQQKTLRRYNPRINSNINGWINWDMNSYDLVNFINAFDDPYMGASTYINKKQRVFIKKVQIHGSELPNHPFMSGLIFRNEKNWLAVSTPDQNSIIVEKVFDKNGNNILNKLKEGDRFYTTPEKKFISRSVRIKYKIK